MSWLASLPHQIPFRAASGATLVDEKTIEGTFLLAAGDALAEGERYPEILLFEAMAQIAGTLVFDAAQHGYLTSIAGASIDEPLQIGDACALRATLEADFGGIYRFRGIALKDGREFARAKLYLAKP